MIFDAHAHFANLSTDIIYKPEYSFEKHLEAMDKYGIEKSIIMVNPMYKILRCKKNIKHKVEVQDSEKTGCLKLYCTNCDEIIYEGPDPLRKYNIELLESAKNHMDRLFPMLYLLLANSTIAEEISFYEENYADFFSGYKLHPRLSYRKLDEITSFPSKKPILIHTGVDFPNTMTNYKFIHNHEGNIILAHAGRFDAQLLYFAKHLPNVYIDSAPASLMFKGKATDLMEPYDELIMEPSDIYTYLIDEIGEDKLLFGSDVPWGNYEDEINIFNSADLSQEVYNKIAYENLINALKTL